MNEQMRKGFDEWFFANYSLDIRANLTKEFMWISWQASRQSLVVKLPEGDGDECGWVVSLVDVEDALDTAGVSYE